MTTLVSLCSVGKDGELQNCLLSALRRSARKRSAPKRPAHALTMTLTLLSEHGPKVIGGVLSDVQA